MRGTFRNAQSSNSDERYMSMTRTGSLAAALALIAATTVAVAPAHAEPAAPATTDTVQYATESGDSPFSGSLENEGVQAGLVLLAGIGVSIGLAISAGIAGGAIELPPIPGLPA